MKGTALSAVAAAVAAANATAVHNALALKRAAEINKQLVAAKLKAMRAAAKVKRPHR